jgi:hypothetical protein
VWRQLYADGEALDADDDPCDFLDDIVTLGNECIALVKVILMFVRTEKTTGTHPSPSTSCWIAGALSILADRRRDPVK